MEKIIEQCRESVEDFAFSEAKRWKEQHPGGKVIGYFPVYTPVEIIHAAGMLPVAVYGAGNRIEVKQADSRLPSFICSIPRTTVEMAFRGMWDFLDLMLFHPICDVARNLVQIWHRNFSHVPTDLLYLPQNLVSRRSGEYLCDEYARFKRLLEELSGKQISPESLRHSLQLYNRQRALIRRLYEIRRHSPWLISAADTYALLRVGTRIPVEEHLGMLEAVLAELPGRKAKPLDKIRVVFEGSFCEQPPLEFIEVIEDVCDIVEDDFIMASRWITGPVPEEGDPLRALALSYRDLFSYSSIQHDGRRSKSPGLLEKCRRSGAQAVILSPPKFCEPGLDDQVLFAQALQQEGIPYLAMEFEEKMTTFEPVRLQVETFAESLLFYA
ncbi:MAG: 2-hydroxyacyl-CoA dehydratase [Nitrospinae bacterium]|nr:2-hydroxyacyl-CoA dehydratase [Nitrospinota bacterium]